MVLGQGEQPPSRLANHDAEDRASIEHERGVWGGMLSRVLVGSQVAAWGLWGGETPLAGAFSRP